MADLERCGGQAEMLTVPPLCPLAVSPYDFSRAGELIERSAAQTSPALCARMKTKLTPKTVESGASNA